VVRFAFYIRWVSRRWTGGGTFIALGKPARLYGRVACIGPHKRAERDRSLERRGAERALPERPSEPTRLQDGEPLMPAVVWQWRSWRRAGAGGGAGPRVRPPAILARYSTDSVLGSLARSGPGWVRGRKSSHAFSRLRPVWFPEALGRHFVLLLPAADSGGRGGSGGSVTVRAGPRAVGRSGSAGLPALYERLLVGAKRRD